MEIRRRDEDLDARLYALDATWAFLKSEAVKTPLFVRGRGMYAGFRVCVAMPIPCRETASVDRNCGKKVGTRKGRCVRRCGHSSDSYRDNHRVLRSGLRDWVLPDNKRKP